MTIGFSYFFAAGRYFPTSYGSALGEVMEPFPHR